VAEPASGVAPRPLEGRVALVTGASRGIGRAVAIELGRQGARVVLAARTQGGLEETDDLVRAAGGQASLLPLDLGPKAKGDELDMVGPSIVSKFGRLDILVANAGALGTLTPVAHITPKDWAETVAVNLTSAWRLIRTCDPALRASESGRAVFVTTGRVNRPKAYWGAYGATKAGMEHLVLTWAQEVASTNLRVTLFDPGVVATRMRASAMPGEDQATLAGPDKVAPALVALCLPDSLAHGAIHRAAS